jgi:hypothetical protein
VDWNAVDTWQYSAALLEAHRFRQAYRAAIDPHKRIKPNNCNEARSPCAMACRFQTDFQFMGNCSGFQLVISSSTDRFNQIEDAVAAEKQNRDPQIARFAALFSLKRSA